MRLWRGERLAKREAIALAGISARERAAGTLDEARFELLCTKPAFAIGHELRRTIEQHVKCSSGSPFASFSQDREVAIRYATGLLISIEIEVRAEEEFPLFPSAPPL